ncbi:hypothetical protein [Peribacillus loiseleuriae]|uniref:Uncharacterized protein n=1 Tax=Peribacillus loiseleuriae TaxID=1679170 RepID=A0A0K9GSD9_9BACI|nr:hypothetical protein [Peribacillus loiseleuriae]KMY49604.1 hypothetical protein AC625_08655 [Peribacillus loiseleuriae]
MIWLLVSLLGIVIVVFAIIYFFNEAKAFNNKTASTFPLEGGAILLGFLLIVFGILKATGS